MSGAKAVDYQGSRAVSALVNLLLSRRDSLLSAVPSTVPEREVLQLRHAPLPSTSSIFPSDLLESAITEAHAALNDALVRESLHSSRIPRKLVGVSGSSAGPKQGSSAVGAGVSPVVPRQQKPAPGPSSSGTASKKKKAKSKGGPRGGSGCSGAAGTNKGAAGKPSG